MHRRAVIAGLVGIPGCLRLESETPPEDEATPPSAESEQDDLTALPELALDEHWTLELPYEDDPPMDRDIHPEWEWAVLAEETGFVIGDDDGHLIRIDMTTGERVWERRLESGLDDRHSLSYHPGTDTLTCATYDGTLHVREGSDGSPRWTTSFPDMETTAVVQTADRLFVSWGGSAAEDESAVQAFDPHTGSTEWTLARETILDYDESRPLTSVMMGPVSPPVDGILYVGTFNFGLLVDMTDGSIQDVTVSTSRERAQPVTDGYVIPFRPGTVRYDLSREDERWESSPAEQLATGVRTDDEYVYYATEDSHLQADALDTGAEHWRIETEEQVWTTPAPVGDLLWSTTDRRDLLAIEAEAGDPIGTYPLASGVVSQYATVNETLVVRTTGALHRFER